MSHRTPSELEKNRIYVDLTQDDHLAIQNLLSDIASQVGGLDRAARELPVLLRPSKLLSIRSEGDALSGLSEALHLAVKLRRPAPELLQSSVEISSRLQKLNQLIFTTRASGAAKSAVALASKISFGLTGNLQRWAAIESRLLEEPEIRVARS